MKTTTSQKLGITLAGVLALIVLPDHVHAAAIAYTVTDLGTLGDPGPFGNGITSYGRGINASGQISGEADVANGDNHAVGWTGTTPTDLGTLGGGSGRFVQRDLRQRHRTHRFHELPPSLDSRT